MYVCAYIYACVCTHKHMITVYPFIYCTLKLFSCFSYCKSCYNKHEDAYNCIQISISFSLGKHLEVKEMDYVAVLFCIYFLCF